MFGQAAESSIMARKSTFTVSIGADVPHRARLVALWWDAVEVPEYHSINLRKMLGIGGVPVVPQSPGVYAITGRHDAHSGTAVLYIGQAANLRSRVPHSLEDHLSERHARGQRTLVSDVWDLTIRWARVARDIRLTVERLLIMSHSPPFNSQTVRRSLPRKDEHPFVVMSAGRKGPLLPVIAAAYQAPWRNKSGKVGPNA